MNSESAPELIPISMKGSGTFGTEPHIYPVGYVFEALDVENNRKVAVKRVRKAERKISREYQILSELKGNKYCVELLDVFYTVGDNDKLTQNFVFEYVPDSLEDFIVRTKKKAKCIPLATIKSVIKQLLEGLAFVHSKNICHRDLKPDNVLLDDNLNVKICDFGSSKKMDGKSRKNIPHIVSRYYRAPELILCHTDYSTQVDIWAVGCILVELFTLEPLFPGKSEGLQLFEMMALIGSPVEEDRIYLYNSLTEGTRKTIEQIGSLPAMDLKIVFPSSFKSTDVVQAADLAKQMLEWNPQKRITARQALKHPFFKFF